jgi:hypothetical protein
MPPYDDRAYLRLPSLSPPSVPNAPPDRPGDMIGWEQSIDSVTAGGTRPVPSVHGVLTTALAAANPGVVALATMCVLAFGAAWYLARAPRDYPFRSVALVVSVLAGAGSGSLLAWRSWNVGADALPTIVARAHSAVGAVAESTPVGALGSYVPLLTGTSTPAREQLPPELGTTAAWGVTVPMAGRTAITYYRQPAHHSGWFIEFDSPTMLVLMRHQSILGLPVAERVRVRVVGPAGDRTPNGSRLEYVLTRRY